ncbi:MAG: DUF2007 domain-containing protein [Chitinophagaceae bacterium]
MNYIPIRAYDNYINANMELGLLREAGIDCHIKDEYTITIDPLLSPALGGMKLMVEERSAAEALDLLLESDRLYLKSVPCPNCKEHSLELITNIKRFNNLAGRLRSLLINGQEEEVKTFYRCNNCFREISTLPSALDK